MFSEEYQKSSFNLDYYIELLEEIKQEEFCYEEIQIDFMAKVIP
jgi:hypothetical protein